MGKIILLVVGAAWAAVLIPPLLRSRADNRPNSSVVDFRRQLSTLQRTVPSRGLTPMRSMARPLAPSARSAVPFRSVTPVSSRVGLRSHGAPETVESASSFEQARHGSLQRSPVYPVQDAALRVRSHHHPQEPAHAVPRRELVRRRRLNVLAFLVIAVGVSAAGAFSTKQDGWVYAFVFGAVALVGYCYRLVQLRRMADGTAYGSEMYYRAA